MDRGQPPASTSGDIHDGWSGYKKNDLRLYKIFQINPCTGSLSLQQQGENVLLFTLLLRKGDGQSETSITF